MHDENDYDGVMSIDGQPFFCSWSGGKDSCLALYNTISRRGRPQCLLTMLDETGERSRSHGLPKDLVIRQAERLGLPAVFRSAAWDEYENQCIDALHEMKEKGLHYGVFGDIDVEAHLRWVRRVCDTAEVTAYHPLWQRNRKELLDEFITLGFEAMIVVLKSEQLGEEFLGKPINESTVAELEKAGIDPSGELGEYHTVVTNGPIFSSKVPVKQKGQITHNGYKFLELA